MVNTKPLIILAAIILILPTITTATPELPTEFYGRASIFNAPATPGTQVKAYDPEGNLCGVFEITRTGYYGSMTCRGKDLDGTGPTQGQPIKFRLGTYAASNLKGTNITTLNAATWESGTFKEINLVSPPIVCGDNFCDNYESCNSCEEDCGACPSGSESGSSSGSSGGDGGGSGSSGSGSEFNPDIEFPQQFTERPDEAETCEETWTCTDWSICFMNETRHRECADLNECETEENKPREVEECEYEELTTTETNYTDNETQEDKTVEIPGVVTTCNTRMNPLSTPSILFIFVILLILAATWGRLKYKLRKIKRSKLEDIEKLQLKFKYKKDTYILTIIISVLAIIVWLYHYFFFNCPEIYLEHLWLLASFLILSPVIIHTIIELMKYHESRKLAKLELFRDTHYNHFKNLIRILDTNLMEIERNITNKIDILENSTKFSELLKNHTELDIIYRDSKKLYEAYSKGKDPADEERDLIENMVEFKDSKDIEKIATEHPEIKSLLTDIEELFNQYKQKQELYDEITLIEETYQKSADEFIKGTVKEKKDKDSEDKKDSENTLI